MSARPNPRWSPSETKALRESYVSGGLKRAAAALPHRSVYSINCKAHRLGLKVAEPNYHGRSYKLAGADLEEAMRLREQGWSFLRIGARFGMSECSASNALIREQCLRGGFTPAERHENGRLTTAGRERLRWMLKKGLKAVEIQLRLGVSAASVHNERVKYNAELKAKGKALLPPAGNGQSYSGARIGSAKRKEAERLFLEGYGTLKVSRMSGVSKTVCTRIRSKLIRRLKAKGEALPGCDTDGRRRQMKDHLRHVPDELRAKFVELIMQRVSVCRAARIAGIGSSSGYKIRDSLKAEGIAVPRPLLLGKIRPLQRELLNAQAIPPGEMWRYRRLVRDLGDADKARAALRAQIAEEKRSRTFEDKVRLVAQGRAKVAAVHKIVATGPDFTLGGVVGAIL
jgi:transposase